MSDVRLNRAHVKSYRPRMLIVRQPGLKSSHAIQASPIRIVTILPKKPDVPLVIRR